MYSPKIGMVGLWALWSLSLPRSWALLVLAMPKLDYILYFTATQFF